MNLGQRELVCSWCTNMRDGTIVSLCKIMRVDEGAGSPAAFVECISGKCRGTHCWRLWSCGGNSRCRRAHRGRRGTTYRSASLKSVRHPEFFGHRLQTSMTRATRQVEAKPSVRDVLWLVGLSFHGVWMLCVSGRIQAQGVRRRPLQAWVSCSGGRTLACGPHALGGDQCGKQRGPDLKHIRTRQRTQTGQWTTL